MPRIPPFGTPAHDRIAAKTRTLEGLLKNCSKLELEMLIRYYVKGQDEQTVARGTGCSASSFERLRRRLREGAVAERPEARAATAE